MVLDLELLDFSLEEVSLGTEYFRYLFDKGLPSLVEDK